MGPFIKAPPQCLAVHKHHFYHYKFISLHSIEKYESLKDSREGKTSRNELRKEQGPITLLCSERVKTICLCSFPSKGNQYLKCSAF